MADTVFEIKLSEGFKGQRSLVLPRIMLDRAESDPILSELHITAIGYYPKASNHYRQRDEPICEYVLIYCSEGKGWYRVGSKEHKVGPNTFFILPAGGPHAYGADRSRPWTIYWIHFRGLMAPNYAEGLSQPLTIKPDADSRIRDMTDLFEEILNVLDDGFTADGMRYAASLFHHYLGEIRHIREYRHQKSSADDDVIAATIHYMEENIEQKLTLPMIAEYSGLSQSYLSAIFRKKTGHAPLAFLNLMRVKSACRMLTETDMKINTICHKVGFQDPYYFSRIFSKLMGTSPSGYRISSTI